MVVIAVCCRHGGSPQRARGRATVHLGGRFAGGWAILFRRPFFALHHSGARHCWQAGTGGASFADGCSPPATRRGRPQGGTWPISGLSRARSRAFLDQPAPTISCSSRLRGRKTLKTLLMGTARLDPGGNLHGGGPTWGAAHVSRPNAQKTAPDDLRHRGRSAARSDARRLFGFMGGLVLSGGISGCCRCFGLHHNNLF